MFISREIHNINVSSTYKIRGAPISKLTDIPITDISAIKNTNTDVNTDIAAPF